MNESQYRQVCEACDQVLKAPDVNRETVAIPWLHVIREHPSFLKDYERLFSTSTLVSRVAKISVIKARMLGGWLRQMWNAIRSNGVPWRASQLLSEPVDVLFVSHLLNSDGAGNVADFYYGNLPELVRAHGRRVVVALIDHSETQDAALVQRWEEAASPRVLLSSTLDLQGEIALFLQLRRESLRLMMLSRRESDSFLKKVYSIAALEAISGGSRSTLRMSVQLSSLIAAVKPKVMIVTYEGHAWERTAFAAAREVSASVQCVGYQHAAVFRLQHSALRMLGSPYDPDLILTAGAVSKGQIESAMTARRIPVRVLGSNRGFLGVKSDKAREVGKNDIVSGTAPATIDICLVLPEGLVSECLLMFEFSMACAALIPDMRFIWRLHPMVDLEALLAKSSSLRQLPANVEFSRTQLADDLRRADYALYRGSTAIVQAVGLGLRPIYLEQSGEMSIDPLYELDAIRTKVSTPIEFQMAVHNGKLKSNGADINQESAIRYCEAFYTPVDSAVILSILSTSDRH